MTGKEVFDLALSYLFEQTDTGGIEPLVLGWLNVLLSEALPTENGMRICRGVPVLTAPPVLLSLEETIPYMPEIVRVALPYGLASWLYAEDDNDYSSQDYRGRYINALGDLRQLREEGVVDLYA